MKVAAGRAEGDERAPIGLVLFTTSACHFCRAVSSVILPRLRNAYVTKGLLRIDYRQGPLVDQSSSEFRAASAAVCAGQQGQYVPMQNRLLSGKASPKPRMIIGLAEELALDIPRFTECLAKSGPEQVASDSIEGSRAEVRVLPTFLIGLANGETRDIRTRVAGPVSIRTITDAIDELLKER